MNQPRAGSEPGDPSAAVTAAAVDEQALTDLLTAFGTLP